MEQDENARLLVDSARRHRPKGLDAEPLARVKKALKKGFPVAETVALTGTSLFSVKRHRKHLRAVLRHWPASSTGLA